MKKAGFLFWPLRFGTFRRHRLLASVFFLLFLGFGGCSYYKVNKTPLDDLSQAQIQKLEPEEKYVIFHSGKQMMHLNEVTVDDDKKELRGVVTTLNLPHRYKRPEH